MNVIVRIVGSNARILEARQQVVLVYQNCTGGPKKYDDSVIINRTQEAQFDLQTFIRVYGVCQQNEKIFLYKFVQQDYTDFFTGKVKYKVGATIECPDWNTDINKECGGGLHLSPSIEFCKQFNDHPNGRTLKCEVATDDILVHPNPRYPFKVRCKRVKVLEEIIE